MTLRPRRVGCALLLASLAAQAQAAISQDDAGAAVDLARPAQRISLAPHVTELLFAAGAAASVVGRGRVQRLPGGGEESPADRPT